MSYGYNQSLASPVSCYKLPTFKGWMALSNIRDKDKTNYIMNELHYVISSNMESVILFSETLQAECHNNGLSEQVSAEVRLAIVEALNNVVEHSFKSQSQHEIDIYITFYTDKIRVRFTDNGRPNPNGVTPVNLNMNPDDIMDLPEGGYGLNIIHQIMDEVNYTRKNNINMMTLIKII